MKTEVKKRNKASLALYIVAVLFGIYAIFSLINSTLYISNLISTQYITVSESLTDIIVYFVTNSAPYIFYAAALGGIGYLVEKVTENLKAEAPEAEEAESAIVPETVEEVPAAEEARAMAMETAEVETMSEDGEVSVNREAVNVESEAEVVSETEKSLDSLKEIPATKA